MCVFRLIDKKTKVPNAIYHSKNEQTLNKLQHIISVLSTAGYLPTTGYVSLKENQAQTSTSKRYTLQAQTDQNMPQSKY